MYELICHSKCAKCLRDEQYSMYSKECGRIMFYPEDSPKLKIYEHKDFENSKRSEDEINKIVKIYREYSQMKCKSELVKGFLTIVKSDTDVYKNLTKQTLEDYQVSLNYCYGPDE